MPGESSKEILVFCDGSSKGNPGPGGWGSLIASPAWVRELGGLSWNTTNNQMELTSAIEALRYLSASDFSEFFPGDAQTNKINLEIFTDSKYLIQGATAWGFGWEKNGWLTKDGTPVLNQGYWQELFEILKRLKRNPKLTIFWNHVPGHAGVEGNERVDTIAQGFAVNDDVELFLGEMKQYEGAHGISFGVLLKAKELALLKKAEAKDKGKAGTASAAATEPGYPRYLSLARGELKNHLSWPECQNRVAGVSGAKFKKVKNLAEELTVKKSWGFHE